MVRTGATFALISGIAAVMGEEPLTIALEKSSDVAKLWGSSRFFSKLNEIIDEDLTFGADESNRSKPSGL